MFLSEIKFKIILYKNILFLNYIINCNYSVFLFNYLILVIRSFICICSCYFLFVHRMEITYFQIVFSDQN